jgi:hypothetical protein
VPGDTPPVCPQARPRSGWPLLVEAGAPALEEVAMTSKQDFTDEEWTRIRRAPLVAGEQQMLDRVRAALGVT